MRSKFSSLRSVYLDLFNDLEEESRCEIIFPRNHVCPPKCIKVKSYSKTIHSTPKSDQTNESIKNLEASQELKEKLGIESHEIVVEADVKSNENDKVVSEENQDVNGADDSSLTNVTFTGKLLYSA